MHFKLIIAFVEDRVTDDVLEAARKAGATGSTVINQARGEGVEQTRTFLGLSLDTQNRLDFSKIVELAQPVYFPETGTDLEQVSMTYQAVRERPSAANDLIGVGTSAGGFILSGAPPVPGGPFNDPCIDDAGAVLNTGVLGAFFDGDFKRDLNRSWIFITISVDSFDFKKMTTIG